MARIVVIEDEIDLANLYRMALEKRSHEVVGIFDDTNDALASSPRSSPVDLILLDERLNGSSGTAALPDLKKTFPDAAIIVATADPEAGARALTLGADAIEKKPFSVRALVSRIDDMLSKRQAP